MKIFNIDKFAHKTIKSHLKNDSFDNLPEKVLEILMNKLKSLNIDSYTLYDDEIFQNLMENNKQGEIETNLRVIKIAEKLFSKLEKNLINKKQVDCHIFLQPFLLLIGYFETQLQVFCLKLIFQHIQELNYEST